MIITYENYRGGINNLIVCSCGLGRKDTYCGIVGTSQKNEKSAIKNFKRNYKKQMGFAYSA